MQCSGHSILIHTLAHTARSRPSIRGLKHDPKANDAPQWPPRQNRQEGFCYTKRLFGERQVSLAWRCFLACHFKRLSSRYLSDLRSPQFTERTRLTALRRVRTERVTRRPCRATAPSLRAVHRTSHRCTRVKSSFFPVKIALGVTNVCDMPLYQFSDFR